MNGTGDGAATADSTGLFCVGEGGGTAFGAGFEGVGAGAGDGAGDAEVDAAGVGLELAEGPPSLANRFKRICVAPVSTYRSLRGF